VLFGRCDFKAKAVTLDHQTHWLLGARARAVFFWLAPPRTPPTGVSRAFVDGGIYVLTTAIDTPREIRLIVDAAPLGYGRLAAHGHADALQFVLAVGGRQLFVDPGTYSYHTEGAWRAYFRGTGAHNTVRIDGLDQSVAGGNFMWLRQAVTTRGAWSTSAACDTLEASHDGYRRLADPVTHTRRFSFDKVARRIVIDDLLDMAGEHDVELNFHCSEACAVVFMDDGAAGRRGAWRVMHGDHGVLLTLPDVVAARTAVLCGSGAPPAGWVSRSFDVKSPAPTLRWTARLRGPQVLRSVIQC